MHNTQPTTPEEIAEFVDSLMARNRALYGGFVMEGDGTDSDDEASEDEGTDGESSDDEDSSEDSSDADGGGEDEDDDSDGSGALGDKGKQALERMKTKLKNERVKRREAESKLADQDGADKADTEALKRANDRIRKAEVKAAAKGVLADPSDAYKFIDLDSFEVDDDGNVDEDEIAEAIEDLVKDKPYLAAQGGRRFKGGAGGGARKESRPKQLTRADLKGMTPQEIDKAHKDGRLADLLQSKQ